MVAIMLRVPALGPSSLWLDDAWIALSYRLSAPSDILAAGLTAPGFAVLLKLWLSAVGFSEAAAQALPFAAGVATPPAVYLVGRRIGLSIPTASVAGLVLLLSPMHVRYSARVKPFAVDALLGTVLIWLAWRTMEDPLSQSRWAALAGLSLIATIVSTSVLPVALAAMAAALAAAWHGPARRRATAWSVGYLATAGAWVLVVVAPRVGGALKGYWAGRYLQRPQDVWRILRSFASDMIALEHGLAVALLTVALVTAFVAKGRRRPAILLLFAGPVAIAAAGAVAGQVPLGTGRTDIYLYPVLALGVGWTLDQLAWPPWTAVLVIVGVLALSVPPPVARYPAEELGPLTAVLEEELEAHDYVLLTGSTVYGVALYGPWTAGIEPARTSTGFTPVFDDDRIDRAPGRRRLGRLPNALNAVPADGHVWLFSSRTSDEQGEILRRILETSGWQLDTTWQADGASLQRWTRSDLDRSQRWRDEPPGTLWTA